MTFIRRIDHALGCMGGGMVLLMNVSECHRGAGCPSAGGGNFYGKSLPRGDPAMERLYFGATLL